MKRLAIALVLAIALLISSATPALAGGVSVRTSARAHKAGKLHVDFKAKTSRKSKIQIRVYSGKRLVRTLRTTKSRINSAVVWNLKNSRGRSVAPGKYTYVVTARAGSRTGSKRGRIVVPKPAPAPAPAPTPVAPGTRFFGAYVHGAPDSMQPVVDLESKVAEHAAVVHFYVALKEGFPTNRVSSIASHGSIPMITLEFWNPASGVAQPSYSLKSISSGAWDAQIRAFAQGAKNAGGTIWVRPLHEMNGNWYPWCGTVNGNAPADYVPAWKHIVDVVRAEGATNVQFVWCPNNDSVSNTAANAIAKYWPGDGYVDRIALDGYNFGTGLSWSTWRSFADTFKSSYAAVTALSAAKPIFVAEMGCSPVGGNKAAWIAEMFRVIPTSFPRIGGIVWFDTNAECDFRIESDASVANAFKAGLAAF